MADEEVIKSVRLSPEEANLLDEQKISFTDLVKESIENKRKDKKATSKKEIVNKIMINGFYAILGLMFLFALNFSSNIITIGIVGGLGALFTTMGMFNLYLAIREVQHGKR